MKERVIVPDVTTEPNWRDQYHLDLAIRNGIRAAWSEPILTKDNEVLGTFALYSHEPRVPTEEDLALIQGAGHIARIAIERQRSQESLKSVLEKIKNSEARLRRVIDTIPTLAWCNLPDGSNEFLNQRWHEYTGLTPEESHGHGWQFAVHPDHLGESDAAGRKEWIAALDTIESLKPVAAIAGHKRPGAPDMPSNIEAT